MKPTTTVEHPATSSVLGPAKVLEKGRESSLYTLIVGCYVAVIIVTIGICSKFITIGPWTLNGSTLIWPLSYVFNDIFTEVYGYRRSRQIIWTGVIVQILAASAYWLVGVVPAAPFWHEQAAYTTILGQAPRIVAVGLISYFFAEYTNSVLISKLKYKQGGAGGLSLCSRFLASTAAGELVDTLIFFPGAFLGVVPLPDLLRTMGFIYIAKIVYEIISLPLSTHLTSFIKEKENIDVIDDPLTTNYSPMLSLSE